MGFVKSLFKKPKTSQQTSESKNLAFDQIKGTFGPSTEAGAGATNFLAQLLGVGGEGGAAGGFQNYLDQSGYGSAVRDITRSGVASGAARGLLNSGSTAGAIANRVEQEKGSRFDNYLSSLAGLSGIGQGAGGLIAGAGQVSQGEGFSRGGSSPLGTIGKTLGTAFSLFSDRRLKKDIELIEREPDGLGIYQYRFIDSDKIDVGVMADEVAVLRPWALGPVVGGAQTVNYEAL